MKKFIFSALACVAFAGSSFASNEAIENNFCLNKKLETSIFVIKANEIISNVNNLNLLEYPCKYSITVVNKKDELLDSMIGLGTEGGQPCLDLMNGNVKRFRELYPDAIIVIEIIAM